jgi:hypothetical protein
LASSMAMVLVNGDESIEPGIMENAGGYGGRPARRWHVDDPVIGLLAAEHRPKTRSMAWVCLLSGASRRPP